MDQDLYGLQASGIDPEIAAQMLGLKRSRGVAEALLKQSMTPLSAGPTPQGGFTPRIHPLQGIAQIVQAYMARKGLEDADTTEAGLGRKNSEITSAAVDQYQKLRQGMPEQAPTTPNDDEGNPMPPVAATPGDPRAAIAFAQTKNVLKGNPLIGADIKAMEKANEPYSLRQGEIRNIGTQTIARNEAKIQPMFKTIGLAGNKEQQFVSQDGGKTWNPEGQPTDKFNPRPAAIVNIDNKAQLAGEVEMAKKDADTVNTLRQSGIAAGHTENVVNRMKRAVESDNTTHGIGAETVATLQNVAVTLGDKDLAARASTNEQYIGDVANLVREKIKALGSGTAISNTDLLFTKQSMPDLLKTKQGKLKIFDAMQKDLAYIKEEAASADKHFRTNKGSLGGWSYKPQGQDTGFKIVE